jgi:UDP-glucose 4-epimerase
VKTYSIIGGAGFIGSHFTEHLLRDANARVVVIDDLSSGGSERINEFLNNEALKLVELDATNTDQLARVLADNNTNTIIHLASNPDIAAAMTSPSIDFDRGTLITESVIEAARLSMTSTVLYASGSGVYGDYGFETCYEDTTIPKPISTYGASKLAGEAILSAYAHMSKIRSIAFRFGNVVGSRATHGVYFDFVNRLHENPSKLEVRGDGSQSKSYVHVNDVINAVLLAESRTSSNFEVFNVATLDYVTVREIVDLAIATGGINRDKIDVIYEDSARGWLGDVPIVRLDSGRIRTLGWSSRFTSREAITAALESRWNEVRRTEHIT